MKDLCSVSIPVKASKHDIRAKIKPLKLSILINNKKKQENLRYVSNKRFYPRKKN